MEEEKQLTVGELIARLEKRDRQAFVYMDSQYGPLSVYKSEIGILGGFRDTQGGFSERTRRRKPEPAIMIHQ